MKAKIQSTKEVNVKYLVIDTNVRYWQDTDINGEEDIDFMETNGEGEPKMPGAYKVKDEPSDHIMSDHWRWKVVIDVEEGRILDWPDDVVANVHYKVCDEGEYTLLDENMNEIIKVESYVPDCIGEYGDYIILNIDEHGYINDFSFTPKDVSSIIKNAF